MGDGQEPLLVLLMLWAAKANAHVHQVAQFALGHGPMQEHLDVKAKTFQSCLANAGVDEAGHAQPFTA